MNIKNAIVLVEQIDLEAKMGKKPLDAVVSATTSRIVPVSYTHLDVYKRQQQQKSYLRFLN